MTLEARPLHLFSTDYAVRSGDDAITVVDLAAIGSRGSFTLDGAEYRIRTHGLAYAAFSLERAGREVARAERESLLPLRYRVRLHDRALTLRSHPPTRRFTILHGDRKIGSIRPRRLVSRTALFDGGEELPVPIRVFVLVVVLLKWRRRARSSSGG